MFARKAINQKRLAVNRWQHKYKNKIKQKLFDIIKIKQILKHTNKSNIQYVQKHVIKLSLTRKAI